MESELLANEISSLKAAMRGSAKLEATYALGRIASSIVDEEFPVSAGNARLYRGEFVKFDAERFVSALKANGITSHAIELLGSDLKTLIRDHGIDLDSAKMEEIARYHQIGATKTIWKGGKAHCVTITPFVSLSSSIDTALRSAVNLVEMKTGVEIGMYTEEDGSYNSLFLQKIKSRLSEGYSPLVYIIDAPKALILELSAASSMKFNGLGNHIIKNSANEYGEDEYLAAIVPPETIRGFMVFTGDPYEPGESYWRFSTL